MSRVHQDPGFLCDQFEASRQADLCKAMAHSLDKFRITPAPQFPQSRDRDGRIVNLVFSVYAETRSNFEPIGFAVNKGLHDTVCDSAGVPLCRLQRLQYRVFGKTEKRSSHCARSIDHDRAGFFGQGPHNAGNPRLDDPGLLTCDLAKGVAKLFGMFKFNLGNACHLGQYRIRRIQAPAESNFQNDSGNLGLVEEKQRNSGGGVEESRRIFRILLPKRVDFWPYALHRFGQQNIVDRTTINPKTLVPSLKMRRSERPYSLTPGNQNGFRKKTS